MHSPSQRRQRALYLPGFAGKKPTIPTDFQELERRAQEFMKREAYAYIAGGAGSGNTLDHNRAALDQWRIHPRMLRDVSERSLEIELFGHPYPTPLLTAPIGVLELAHSKADLAVAQATSALGIPMIFSNQASYPMEECAAQMGDSPRWFQLYWSKSDELVVSFLQRAEACGCHAIVVTLDTTLLGWRPEDLNLGFLPFSRGMGLGQYTSDPVFQRLVHERHTTTPPESEGGLTLTKLVNIYRLMKRYPNGSFWQHLRSKLPVTGVRTFIDMYSRPSICWEELAFIREHTSLPILLKGILHAADAKKALDAGMNGIIVSNHGGRQINGSISAIEALPEIVAAVQGQVPILMDSGIRDGADVFKALALGAQAVCVGRPYVYGLAMGGAQGVQEVLENLLAEFELTMALAGCKSVKEVGREMLWRD